MVDEADHHHCSAERYEAARSSGTELGREYEIQPDAVTLPLKGGAFVMEVRSRYDCEASTGPSQWTDKTQARALSWTICFVHVSGSAMVQISRVSGPLCRI